MEEETRLQLVSLAGSVNSELTSVAAQLHQALEESAQAAEGRESLLLAQMRALQFKCDEDVGMLRMQIEEMSEAREVF